MTKEIDEIITRKKFRELSKISRTTEWRMGVKNQLPKRVVVDGTILGYLKSSINNWFDTHS